MEDLVTIETGKLAKEKGFDEPCVAFYDSYNGANHLFLTTRVKSTFLGKMLNIIPERIFVNHSHLEYVEGNNTTLAPTQAQLQKWLRDEHKLRVFVTQGISGNFNFEIYKWNYDNQIGKWERIGNISSVATYEDALEKGLINALNLIEL